MRKTFKEVRKTIPLNQYIYVSVQHDLEFSTVKKIGTKYDKLYVDVDGLLGDKRYLVLTWY